MTLGTTDRDGGGFHEPTSNTITPKYGTIHAYVTALVNLRQRCMSLQVADGGTTLRRTDHQISNLARRVNTLTNSRDHIALNYRDRRCCTCLEGMSQSVTNGKSHHRTTVNRTRNTSIARLLSHIAHVLIARMTSRWMSVSSAAMQDTLTF